MYISSENFNKINYSIKSELLNKDQNFPERSLTLNSVPPDKLFNLIDKEKFQSMAKILINSMNAKIKNFDYLRALMDVKNYRMFKNYLLYNFH